MIRFENAQQTFWNGKPLVRHQETVTTGELAVLAELCGTSEDGVWMNSRGVRTGVRSLQRKDLGQEGYRTVRVPLPPDVSSKLATLYRASGLKRGCPDVVIWNQRGRLIRLIEVKGPRDSVKPEQTQFIKTAEEHGIRCQIVEWGFA